jgi:hypothetical protein
MNETCMSFDFNKVTIKRRHLKSMGAAEEVARISRHDLFPKNI